MRRKLFLLFNVILITLLALTYVDTAFSENNWIKTYGGSDDDLANSIQQTSDGGYIVTGAGDTYSFGEGERDAWVLKLNQDGSIDWQKTYGGGYGLYQFHSPDR